MRTKVEILENIGFGGLFFVKRQLMIGSFVVKDCRGGRTRSMFTCTQCLGLREERQEHQSLPADWKGLEAFLPAFSV